MGDIFLEHHKQVLVLLVLVALLSSLGVTSEGLLHALDGIGVDLFDLLTRVVLRVQQIRDVVLDREIYHLPTDDHYKDQLLKHVHETVL